MIEGAKGFAVSFARQPNLDAAVDNLGQVFEVSTLAYKPYPSGVVIHPIIDACLEIANSNAFDAAQIERIELEQILAQCWHIEECPLVGPFCGELAKA